MMMQVASCNNNSNLQKAVPREYIHHTGGRGPRLRTTAGEGGVVASALKESIPVAMNKKVPLIMVLEEHMLLLIL